MRIHTLSFQALGPFPGEHVIGFDGLGDASLFLIDGHTGSGKSTIIDAIVFALYGGVAGRASNRDRLRSDFAGPDVDSYAEIDFSTSAGRFKVRRTPEYTRTKRRGLGVTAVASSVVAFRSTGEGWEPVSGSKGEADAEILGWIGLTRAQFLQTVVLPQGEFATFLAAESKDRLAVLERIFATDLYSRIEQAFDERRRVAQTARDTAADAVVVAIRAVYGRLPDEHPHRADAVADGSGTAPDTAQALHALLDEVAADLAEQSARAVDLEARLVAADADLTTFRRAAEARQRRSDAVDRLVLARAGQVQAREALNQHAEVLATAGAAGAPADEALTAVARQLGNLTHAHALEARLPADDEAVAASVADLARIDSLICAVDEERDHGLPRRLHELATRVGFALAAASAAAEDARRAEAALLQARLDGMAAELAVELVDGQPCSVCGATDHPHPARPIVPQVTPAAVSAAARARKSADEHWHAVDVQRAALAVVAPAAETESESETTRQVPVQPAAVGDVAAIHAAIAQVQDALVSIGERRAALDVERARAVAELAQTQQNLADHQQSVRQAMGAFASVAALIVALGDAQAALKAVTAAAEAVSAAEGAVRTAESDEALVGAQISESDLSDLRQVREELAAQARRARSAQVGTDSLHRDLTTRIAAVADSTHAATKVRATTSEVISLAGIVKGADGNRLSQPLSAFVVQTMFDEVLAGANRRLRGMLDGRFELQSTEERTGRAFTGLGLGLEVRDLRTESTRKTSTLSGGESFCASLALALGLADAVRAHAGGIDIGMLFIDEGFGSLDADRLDDVMTELGRLQADGRTVAVISHVSEMKRAITERIDVREIAPRSGSTLTVSWTD